MYASSDESESKRERERMIVREGRVGRFTGPLTYGIPACARDCESRSKLRRSCEPRDEAMGRAAHTHIAYGRVAYVRRTPKQVR